MAMNQPGPFGVSFAPTGDNLDEAQRQQQGISRSSQDALQVLNLQLPRVVGARAPASSELLRARPGAATVDRAVLHSILRTLGVNPAAVVPANLTADPGAVSAGPFTSGSVVPHGPQSGNPFGSGRGQGRGGSRPGAGGGVFGGSAFADAARPDTGFSYGNVLPPLGGYTA